MTTVRLQGQGVAELYRRLQTPEGRVLIRSHQRDLDLRTLMLDEGRRSGPVALIRSRSGEHGLALGLDSTNGAQAGLCVISPSSDEALPLHRQLRDVRSMIALVEPYLRSVEELFHWAKDGTTAQQAPVSHIERSLNRYSRTLESSVMVWFWLCSSS